MGFYGIFLFLLLFVPSLHASNYTVDGFVNYITNYIASTASYVLPTDHSELIKTSDNKEYDYGCFDFIIVGGGTAGSLLANRLSQISSWNILLLEAGGNDDAFSRVPAFNGYLRNSPMNWGYFTSPQKNACQGMVNKSCVYPTGKVMGGSGTIGDMIYTRGNKGDYNTWYNEGNVGWSYTDVLPYFKKSEQVQIPDYDKCYHGHTGEVKINYTAPVPINYDALVNGNKGPCIQVRDPNGRQQTGVSKPQWTIDFNARVTGYSAFITPIMNNRTNLHISTKSFVTKLLIGGRKALGVEFIKDEKKYKATVSREVILSAGAINSPQILMLSGVGPKDELERLGIQVVNDLPVGRYLKDHPVFTGLYMRTNNSAPNETLYQQVTKYFQGKNPLTSISAGGPLVFINTSNLCSADSNVEISFLNPPYSVPADTSVFYNLDRKHQELFSTFNTLTDHLIYVGVLKPKSYGTVTLKSNSPIDFPVIDPAYYTDPNDEDIQTMYEGIQYVLNFTTSAPLQALNATVVGVAPECAALKETSERKYWLCAIRYLTSTFYHPSCTTRMGTSPESSVVDPSMKVHNMQGLRVVDAGSMPEITSAHILSAVFMLAEKAADLIKEEYLK